VTEAPLSPLRIADARLRTARQSPVVRHPHRRAALRKAVLLWAEGRIRSDCTVGGVDVSDREQVRPHRRRRRRRLRC
jgi:hypothetical protein